MPSLHTFKGIRLLNYSAVFFGVFLPPLLEDAAAEARGRGAGTGISSVLGLSL